MFFFFFSSRRRHTRYIGDWSSDVCSSDLFCGSWDATKGVPYLVAAFSRLVERGVTVLPRSEERRVGKECRSRVWREHYIKKEWSRKVVCLEFNCLLVW